MSGFSIPSRKLRPSLVLFAGFGGLLFFILAAAIGTLVMLERVRNDDKRMRQAFIERLAALEQIRSQIYLSGTYVRDFLLSPDPTGAESQRARLSGIEQETRAALDRYSHPLDPGEQDAFQALRGEIDAYLQVLQTTFDWTPRERDELRYTFFYEQLVPRRTTMLQIADQIGSINQRGLASAEGRFAQSALRLRWSLVATFAVTVLGGIILAVMTAALTLRLEGELEKRGHDLQELSAQLVRTQEQERRMLARELHDEVGQSLSAIMMEAGNTEFASTPEDLRERVQSIGALAAKTLNVVRDLALLLRPSMLDDFGLIPALNWHAREMSKRTGLAIRIAASGACDDLPEEHSTCIYRVAQEALNNATRHSGAQDIQVVVERVSDRVTLNVNDDGSGFDRRLTKGLGLLGMEERVRRLGGKLRVESSQGRGTAIVAELPISHT